MAQKKKVNITPDDFSPHIHVSQYDVGREIVFELTDGSTAYEIPEDAVITFKGTKPSGLGFAVECEYEDNLVTLVTTETVTKEWGRIPVELSVEVDEVLLGSANMLLVVEASPHPEGTIDGDAEDIIPELTQLVIRIEAAAASIHSLSVEAETLDPGHDAEAEYNPVTNKIKFGIPRGYDGFLIEGSIGFTDDNADGNVVISIT